MLLFATANDLKSRHLNDVVILAADEVTREVDWTKVDHSLADASTEVRAILAARYSLAQLSDLDDDSLGALRLYTMDIALYRIAISYSRSSEIIRERYKMAIERLTQLTKGNGGLTFKAQGGVIGGVNTQPGSVTSPNQVVIDVPERVLTRERLRGI